MALLSKLCLFMGSGCLGICAVQICNAKQFDVADSGSYCLYIAWPADCSISRFCALGVIFMLIFIPLAISFVGAAVIWRNIFAGGGIEALEINAHLHLSGWLAESVTWTHSRI